MKKLLALILALLTLISSIALAEPLLGGWAVPEDTAMTDEAQAAFDKAMESLVGVDYAPIACLGTQLVAGQNYCILCKATVVAPDAAPYLALVYVYADLEGNAEITHIQELDIAALSQDAE